MADALREIIAIARRDMPDVPHDVWARFEAVVRLNFGAQRPYIAAQKKRHYLDTIEQLEAQNTTEQIARLLGITPRRVRQLKAIR